MPNGKSWKQFNKYHYLSKNLPGGKNYFFGIFINGKQVGFQCYNAYIPGKTNILYSNRVVIHPDYQGFGLGLKFINETAKYIKKLGFIVRATFSSYPLYKARLKDRKWRLREVKKPLKTNPVSKNIGRSKSISTFRTRVTVYCFDYIG